MKIKGTYKNNPHRVNTAFFCKENHNYGPILSWLERAEELQILCSQPTLLV